MTLLSLAQENLQKNQPELQTQFQSNKNGKDQFIALVNMSIPKDPQILSLVMTSEALIIGLIMTGFRRLFCFLVCCVEVAVQYCYKAS